MLVKYFQVLKQLNQNQMGESGSSSEKNEPTLICGSKTACGCEASKRIGFTRVLCCNKCGGIVDTGWLQLHGLDNHVCKNDEEE